MHVRVRVHAEDGRKELATELKTGALGKHFYPIYSIRCGHTPPLTEEEHGCIPHDSGTTRHPSMVDTGLVWRGHAFPTLGEIVKSGRRCVLLKGGNAYSEESLGALCPYGGADLEYYWANSSTVSGERRG